MTTKPLTEYEMQAYITARIVKDVTSGKSVAEAIDLMFGKGRYNEIADEIYYALREKNELEP